MAGTSPTASAPHPAPSRSRGEFLRRQWAWTPAWIFAAFLGFLILYPFTLLFLAGFQHEDGGFTFANYARIFSDEAMRDQIWATLWLAAVRSILATALGIFLAWVTARTDTPFRGAISAFVWIGYFAPALPLLLAWVLLAGRVGLINTFLQQMGLAAGPLLDIYSYGGIIFVSTLNFAGLVYILIEPSFRAMDANLEESSRMCGASNVQTLFRITIPTMAPAVLGALIYVFVLAVESFEAELILGTPARIYVLSTGIYALTQEYPQDIPGAATLSAVILLLVTLMIIAQQRLLANRSFVTVSGKGTAVRRIRLGKWRWLTFAICFLYFLLAVALPMAVLLAGTFMRGWGIWDADHLTLANWSGFFADPRLTEAIGNTVWLGVGVGLIGAFGALLIAYLTTRTRFPGNPLLIFASWAPRTAPSVVFGVACAWAFIGGTSLLHPLLGTVWIFILVLFANSLPVATRAVTGAMHQIGPELEQAARITGASWTRMMRSVLLPLLKPVLVSTFVLLFLLATRNLSLLLFFYTPDSRVLSAVLWEAWSGNAPLQGLVAGTVMMLLSCLVLGLARLSGHKMG